MNFEQAIEFVLSHEGELSNDPHDPGRLTKWGISSRFYPEVGAMGFQKEDAVQIYRRHYWDKLRCDDMPEQLRLMLFDAGVNPGPSEAIKLLQGCLKVKVDGVIGPATIEAARRADPVPLLKEFCARRILYYSSLLTFGRYGLGWTRRAVDVLTLSVSS